MSLLILEDVQKHFGAQAVLRGASLRIDPGEKIGLVGRNGGGKTTLLRLIEGLDAPDWGSVTLRRGARLGHVPQRPEFESGVSVRAYVEQGLEAGRAALRDLDLVNHALTAASGDELERLMRRHDELSELVDAIGAWEGERRVETVMSGIGLLESLWEREARTLSGGEKSRTALARELVAGGDILLLDEPTNHLDLEGIEWIENYIRERKTAVLVVSHDRRLLNTAVGAIVELERGRLSRYPGNYDEYVRLKEERFTSEERAFENQQDFLRKEEQFIRQHMGSQRTAEAKGRQKKLENVERLVRPSNDVRRPVIRAPKADRAGEMVLEARSLAGGYGTKAIFKGVDLRIARGERIGIVGKNGAGKTTLLKILAGEIAPLAGELEYGHRAQAGFFDQDTSELRDDSTPYLEIRRDHAELTDQEIRDHLAKFLFRGDDVEVSVASLSGGERARLCLARLTLTQPSWLAMDEPTNHLDLAARTALEEMLGDFQGAVVFVSHDRQFMDGLCNRVLEVDDARVLNYTGNYTTWRQRKAEEAALLEEKKADARTAQKADARAAAAKQAAKQSASGAKTAPSSDAAERTKSAGKPAGKPASTKIKNPWAFEKLEKKIMTLEAELAELQAALTTEEIYRNATRMQDTQYRISEVERDLADANHEWENWG